MEFFTVTLESRLPTDLIVFPFWQNNKKTENASKVNEHKDLLKIPLEMGDFKGKEGEILFLYGPNKKSDKRIVLLGLGEKKEINVERLRRAYSILTKACHQRKLEEISLVIPLIESMKEEEVVKGISEGLLLSNYLYNQLKSEKDDKSILLKKVGLLEVSKNSLDVTKQCKTIAEAVYFARDLVNGNADDVTPQKIAHSAKELAKEFPKLKATILNKKQIINEKMGLLLAVNRGSKHDPAVIILSYQGNPKSKEHTVLIGKGITYDTGGLNLKPMASMETMKSDMAGGAAVLGALYAAASLNLKVNVTAVVPATENSIDANSFKLGDVYKSCKGTTVEINNTDAEGRLILADAFTYVCKKLRPTRIIDIATLTGAIDIALGPEAGGLFSNNDALADSLLHAGANTFERLWRMPIFEEYRDSLKSHVADMRNAGTRSGGATIAALFLKDFIEDIPWAHIDIASTGFLSDGRRYHPKGGTGFGVRLLVDYLQNLSH